MTKEEFGRVVGGLAKSTSQAPKDDPVRCLCGCGQAVTSNSKFLPGHDQKLRAALEDAVGGLEALKELVEGHVGRPIGSNA